MRERKRGSGKPWQPGTNGRPPIGSDYWTAEEDALILGLKPREAAKRLDRAVTSIYSRRARVKGKAG
jgi:hypothetical protein